jgi:pyocin large subunit-like protein
MSISAMNWALKAKPNSSSQKLILICLAACATEKGECWPSQKTISKITLLDLKTVGKCLQELVELGLLENTGKRAGSNNRSKVYRLVGGA